MSKMKQNEVEWIGEISEDWEVKKVKHSFVHKNEKAMQENPIVLSLARSGVKERDISNNEGQLAESYYNPVDVDDLLIMYYIGSEPGKREIANISKAAAQPSLSMENIRKIKLCIPPFEEQKEIADYLEKKCTVIDTSIEQKQNLIEKLTEYKKSLIYECVTGKKEV